MTRWRPRTSRRTRAGSVAAAAVVSGVAAAVSADAAAVAGAASSSSSSPQAAAPRSRAVDAAASTIRVVMCLVCIPHTIDCWSSSGHRASTSRSVVVPPRQRDGLASERVTSATGGPDAAQCHAGAATGTAGRRTVVQEIAAAPTTTSAAIRITRSKPVSSSAAATAAPGANPASPGWRRRRGADRCGPRRCSLPRQRRHGDPRRTPSAVIVSGATVSARPSPNTTMPGSTAAT